MLAPAPGRISGSPRRTRIDPLAHGLEVGAPGPKKWVGQGRERRPDVIDGPGDGPLGGERLVPDHSPGLTFDLRAAEHQTLSIDERLPIGTATVQEMPETVELLIRHPKRRGQTRLLRLAIGAENPPLGHGNAGDHQMRRTDRDPAGRANALRMLCRAHLPDRHHATPLRVRRRNRERPARKGNHADYICSSASRSGNEMTAMPTAPSETP